MSAPIRVLLADDDVATRIGLHTIISAEPDFEVVGQAGTGVEACQLADQLDPDVVLMDVRMPDLDGIEATRHITRQRDGSDHTPRVIVVTTYEVGDYVYRSLEAGASGFMLKRATPEELLDAIRTVADGDALLAPASTRLLVERFQHPSGTASNGWRSVADLTNREMQVLALVARGMTNTEIAAELFLSVETVKSHVKHIYTKTGAQGRAQLVIAAYETGIVERPT